MRDRDGPAHGGATARVTSGCRPPDLDHDVVGGHFGEVGVAHDFNDHSVHACDGEVVDAAERSTIPRDDSCHQLIDGLA